MKSTYTYWDFTHRMEKPFIRTIVECGSRDGLDAVELLKFYKPQVVFTFECNPESITVCAKNIRGYFPRIRLIGRAVGNIDGMVDFYATDMELSTDKNIGASSLFKHKDNNGKGYVQKKIQVESVRLDTFMEQAQLPVIDLLCMDLQGAEYLAIEGLGERLRDVRYIITEVSPKSSYYGDMLFDDFDRLLREKGFSCFSKVGENALYKNMVNERF